MGAEVIKIEKPGGDASRWIGPFWGNQAHAEKSLSFWYNNTGKLGITLCLESEKDRGIFRSLASKADVVVATFPPEYLRKIGLHFDALSEENPGLIFASVTDFGETGPYKDYKSCDIVASALGGQMHVCGLPSHSPLKPYGQQSYYAASLFAAVGILIALLERHNSGRGQHIDISLQEAVTATLEHVMVRYFYEKVIATRQGNIHWTNLACLLPCKDGYIFITFGREWETLINLLDSEAMAGDLTEQKWYDENYRRQHVSHIVQMLTRWTRTHTTGELFELGQLMHFPWAPVSSPRDVFNSPQLRARNFFVPVEHPEYGVSFIYPGTVTRFSAVEWNIRRRAPLVGEHNAQFCAENSELPDEKKARLSRIDVSQKGPFIHKNALEWLRVLDFTWLLAGPYCTRVLADFGAEVIKIQSRKTATGAESNATGYFNAWNRNKLGITVDMTCSESKELILNLVRISDVVIENFSPRVMANWGLDYPALKEAKPDIIMVSLSGMGQTGPWRDFVALGPTLQALSGITCLTSYSQESPSGIGYSHADIVAGLFATVAVLAALEYRAKTGRGQHIDISEYEAMCSLLGATILDYTANYNPTVPRGNISDDIPACPYGCYRCLGYDRWCVIAVFSDEEWHAMCQAMNNPPWAEQEKFSSLSSRLEHQQELNELVGQWTSNYAPEEVMNMLQKAGVAAGKVNNAIDLANDPQLKSRGFFVQLHHPVLGNTNSDGTPVRLSRTPAGYKRAAPLLGQDNRYVYEDLLGLTKEQLRQYTEKGIIC